MKKIRKLFVLLLGVLVILPLMNTQNVSAANKNVDITISNAKTSVTSFKRYEQVEFSFDFSVPEEANEGDVTKLTLGEEWKFNNDQSFPIYAPDNTTVVANATINKSDNTVTLVYTDYVDKHNDVVGYMKFSMGANRDVVTTDRVLPAEVTINNKFKITLSNSGISYGVGSRDKDSFDFYKYASKSGSSIEDNKIRYILNVNTSNSTRENVIITDKLTTTDIKHIEEKFVINEGTWVKDSNNEWEFKKEKDVTKNVQVEYSNDKSSFTIKLGNISKGYQIGYTVQSNHKLLDGEIINNSATYSADKMTPVEKEEKVIWETASGGAVGYNFSLTIKKVDEDGKLLPNAKFEVKRKSSGEVIGEYTTDANGEFTVNGLLRDIYTVAEIEAPVGYEKAPAQDVEANNNTITITDKKITTSYKGTKIWDDNNDQDGKRPESITVNLLADGVKVDSKEVSADNNGNWTYEFTNLPKYKDGKEITYTVSEDEVKEYTTTYNGNDIVNSYIPGKRSITVNKVWDDSNDKDKLRPTSIKVQLYANGKKVGNEVTLSEANNWRYTFTDSDVKANKKDIEYSVKEVNEVKGYTKEEGEVTNGNVTITNKHTPKTTTTTKVKTGDNTNIVMSTMLLILSL